MAAPMTEFLFLFLLGIASWSYCVADNTVTLTGSSCAAEDGNGIIDTFDCDISDNKLRAGIIIKEACPGVVQANIELLREGNVVNNAGQSYKQVTSDIRDLGICESVEGPDPDGDGCSASEGELAAQNCDVASFFKDMDPGNYDANTEFSIDNNVIARVSMQVKVEAA